jgi:cytochrome c556
MNKRFLAGFGVVAFLAVTALSVAALSQSKEPPAPKPAAAQSGEPLPAALGGLYPPKAQGPLFLVKMIGLAESFGGMLGDLFENDLPNVPAGFERFKAQYAEAAALVPEWKGLYPMAPVDDLGAALKSGDQGRAMAAIEKVGAVCTACHVENMARVQFRYGWPEFSAVKVKDPLTGRDVGFPELMLLLDVSFSGIGADLDQGQAEQALKHFQGFQARFEAVAGTCEECHGQDERKYYVDGGVRGMVEELGKAASAGSAEQARQLVLGIGMESCHKCHLVHTPAAFGQTRLRR